MNLCFYLALSTIPLGIAVTIEFLGPLAVAIGGSRRWLDGLWALFAAGGVVLLTEGRGDLHLAGILFALAAAVCWAGYILLSVALGRHTADGGGLALGMALAAIVVAPVGIVGSGTALLEPWVLAVGLGVALLSSVIPYSLELEALRRIPPKVFGVLMSMEPAVAALVGLIVLGEVLRPLQWAGRAARRHRLRRRDEDGAPGNLTVGRAPRATAAGPVSWLGTGLRRQRKKAHASDVDLRCRRRAGGVGAGPEAARTDRRAGAGAAFVHLRQRPVAVRSPSRPSPTATASATSSSASSRTSARTWPGSRPATWWWRRSCGRTTRATSAARDCRPRAATAAAGAWTAWTAGRARPCGCRRRRARW